MCLRQGDAGATIRSPSLRSSRPIHVRSHMRKCWVLLFTALWTGFVWAQNETTDLNVMEEDYITPVLKYQILSPDVAEFQVRQYLLNQVAAPPQVTSTPQAWTSEAARLRRHLVDDVAFHGWPREWVDAAPGFEEIGVIETGGGYRIRKLR